MGLLTTLGIALGLALDALAVSIAIGLYLCHASARQTARVAFSFGLFQAGMPVFGWLAGRHVAAHIMAWDHWVAFGLLAAIGLKMLWEARRQVAEELRSDPTRGLRLLTLSVATSIDALAVGFSFALLEVAVWRPALLIGLVTALLSALGVRFGCRLGQRWRRVAVLLGGLTLLVIGTHILLAHLLDQP